MSDKLREAAVGVVRVVEGYFEIDAAEEFIPEGVLEAIVDLRAALAATADAQEVKRCEYRNIAGQCLLDAGHGSRGDTQPHICDVSELDADTADAPPEKCTCGRGYDDNCPVHGRLEPSASS